MNFADNPLIRRTLAPQPFPDPHAEPHERLWRALLQFRERAATLANEIHRDLPDFTVHDITHLDALWEMADLIAGPDYPLNPMEAFALGAVFLLHDLGLGLAAWPGGLAEIKKGPGWQDALSTYLRKHLERIPTAEELASPPLEIERMVIQACLRGLHAEQAERLALASWRHKDSPEYHLIEDPDLRQAIGPLLGKIAHSHWWPVPRLGNEFETMRGALADCPREWTLDPLKIAVLLRTADAAHLDARRAPGFLSAFRRPEGIAEDHWRFQKHLLKPQIENDRLVYTTAWPFSPGEVDAWWLCEETLHMVDHELHQVDALLADFSRPRLRAKGVAGIESPKRLQKYIEASDWTPVDARIHVSNVADLARRLGGEQLYGNDPTVPLRELIQNAADAVRARRVLGGLSDNGGHITIRLGHDSQGSWVEVEDTGLGMSEALLTGPLLDFGTTYWGSTLMREEHESLWARGFEPTGIFGIGFFSVFMWGSRVRVTTRRYKEDAQQTTRILEFWTGLTIRPLVRLAKPEEQLSEGGTRVRVWLNKNPREKNGLLWPATIDQPVDLRTLCAWLCPALDVDTYVEEPNAEAQLAIKASDWLTITDAELLSRISLGRPRVSSFFLENAVRIIGDSSSALGRATLVLPLDENAPPNSLAATGAITVGGLRVQSIYCVVGILAGSAPRVARDGVNLLHSVALANWASDQAAFVEKYVDLSPKGQMYYAASVLAFGGDPGRLPIVKRGNEFIDREAIIAWIDAPSKIIFFVAYDMNFPGKINDVILSYGILGGITSAANFEISGGTQNLIEMVKDALSWAWQCLPEDVKVERSSLEYDVGVTPDGLVCTASQVIFFCKP